MRNQTIKVRENRLRRQADRQGLNALTLTEARHARALDYDLYALTTIDEPKGTVHPVGVISPFALTLDEVEARLADDGRCPRCSTELSADGYCGVCNPRGL